MSTEMRGLFLFWVTGIHLSHSTLWAPWFITLESIGHLCCDHMDIQDFTGWWDLFVAIYRVPWMVHNAFHVASLQLRRYVHYLTLQGTC